MKLYRINKVTALGGSVLKKKDVLAASDRQAIEQARESEDCPICEVLSDGRQIGAVV